MTKILFGTDGIRGPAGTYPLNAEGVVQIGKAIGSYFAAPDEYVIVGQDPRESSPELTGSVVAGLNAVGVHAKTVGVIPTPGLAYATKHERAKAGVMITASHNPYTDNGIKIFDPRGTKLPDEVEAAFNQVIDSKIRAGGHGQRIDSRNLLANYEHFLVSSADKIRLDTMSIAVDMANGATSGIATRVFESLGAQVVSLFDHPDGKNINVACGATDTQAIRSVVKEQGLDGGLAFDGDGDRLIVIDQKGRELTGDHILYLLAVAGKHTGVVATVMSNTGLGKALKKHGISLHSTAVGDRYVLEGLKQTGFTLGGEQSGHIVLPGYSLTGDGLLAAIQVLKFVLTSGKNLAEWFDELTLVPQELINIPVTDKTVLKRRDVQAFIAAQTAELGDMGRINIRPSGTEPKIRVMVEAPDAATRASFIVHELTKLFK